VPIATCVVPSVVLVLALVWYAADLLMLVFAGAGPDEGRTMTRDGRIHAETAEFPRTEAVDAYARLKTKRIAGRAVLIPGSVAPLRV
jgi:hypothetical protein